jgi:hypothetical protein
MRTQHIIRNGRVSLPQPTHGRGLFALLTATFALAITFTLNACDSGGGGGGSSPGGNDPFSGDEYYEYLKERVKYYDPDDGERCNNGVVEWVCEVPGGDAWYNPLKQSCERVDYTCEDGNCYGTYELGTIEACGRKLYASHPNIGRCQDGVVQYKCKTADGDKWYNAETHYCDWSYYNGTEISTVKPRERCGSKNYYPDEGYIRCEKGVVEGSCGYGDNTTWYNLETHYCSYSGETVKPKERCGSEYYVPEEGYKRCEKGVVEYRCGSGGNINWYNSITQSCDWNTGTVTNKLRCGS